jgi:hypothetical protein
MDINMHIRGGSIFDLFINPKSSPLRLGDIGYRMQNSKFKIFLSITFLSASIFKSN